MKIKIHKALCFKPQLLYQYLKSRSTFGKREHEIIIALTYRKIVETQYDYSDYFIYFPPQTRHEKELAELMGKTVSVSSVGDLLDRYVEENSLTDIAYIQPRKNNKAGILPYQIKRFGLGDERGGDTSTLLLFLKKLKKFTPSENGLLISLEKVQAINTQQITDWINTESFPFREIVLFGIQKDSSLKLCQLKPNTGTPKCIAFQRDEIITF